MNDEDASRSPWPADEEKYLNNKSTFRLISNYGHFQRLCTLSHAHIITLRSRSNLSATQSLANKSINLKTVQLSISASFKGYSDVEPDCLLEIYIPN